MKRRNFVGGFAGVVGWSACVCAQQQTLKTHRIGYLGSGTPSPSLQDAFRQGLRELGWVEGQNIVIEYRFADGQYDKLPSLADELVRLNVEVIVASPSPAAQAAKNATNSIPIVGIGFDNPVELGLVASLARPGGNVTGLSYSVGPEIFRKDLELLKEVVPKVQLVAILSNPAGPNHVLMAGNVKTAAQSLGVSVLFLDVRRPDEFEDAFAAMATRRVGALFVFGDPLFGVHRARLVDLAARNRLPAMYTNRPFVEAGGLMCYGPSFPDLWRRAASYVDKLLKGTKAANLPVEQPTKFEFVINLKTADALGLTIPPAILVRADQVIE